MHKKTAVIYCRVSTEEQAVEGISLKAQQEQLLAYCAVRGLEPVTVVVDAGVSAGKPLASRPGGVVLLNEVKCGVSAVVAYKLDRLFRNAVDCLAVTGRWERAGVALHLVDMGGQAIDTSTAMGKFFLTVMAGAAEMERNLISERTKAALAHKCSKGERTSGCAPFGFSFDHSFHVVEDPAEQRTIARVAKLRSVGTSIRRIAAILDIEGFKPRGKCWHPTTVATIIKRLDTST